MNKIRLNQIATDELLPFIYGAVISGEAIANFYYPNNNPSGYLNSGQASSLFYPLQSGNSLAGLILSLQTETGVLQGEINILQAATGTLQTEYLNLNSHSGDYYPRTNPSGYATVTALNNSGAFLQSEIATLNNLSGSYLQMHKYVGYLGNGSATGISVIHNLGTQDIFVSIYETGNNKEMVTADIYNTGVNGFLVGFAAAPATNSLRIVVIG